MSSNVASSLSFITKFDGSNYATWATIMKAIFGLHNLDCIVDGSETAPTDAKEASEFAQRSNQAYSLIILSLKDSLYYLIDGHTTAKDLWDHIKKQYGKPDTLAAFLLYRQIHRFTITEGSPIRDQINTLYQHRQNAANAGIKFTNQHFSFCILQALPDSYAPLLSAILATSDMDTIKPDVITARILEEEALQSYLALHRRSSNNRPNFKGVSNKKTGQIERL
jgi:gag-polypeptide of LTR copia-type